MSGIAGGTAAPAGAPVPGQDQDRRPVSGGPRDDGPAAAAGPAGAVSEDGAPGDSAPEDGAPADGAAGDAGAVVRVQRLSMRFGDNVLFRDVSFEVRRGERFVILGGSGCGKSTLLKLLIGLFEPSEGRIELLGRPMFAPPGPDGAPGGVEGEARRDLLRRLGVMWQSGALFGSMTLLENVMLPLEAHTRLPPEAREQVARVKLGLVGLADAADRLPAEISGGMAKRAGIARAMALDPPVLFLDEPSAGLDPITSAGLDELITDLARDLGTTFVIVTHELQSILAIGDRCIMLDKAAKGMIAEGDPKALRDDPPNDTVRRFFRREAE